VKTWAIVARGAIGPTPRRRGRSRSATRSARRTRWASHRDIAVERDADPARPVKVLDFGLAKLARASITNVGMVLGSPYYIAPEQIAGHVTSIFARTSGRSALRCITS
jgi:serine/threonine protein kinase